MKPVQVLLDEPLLEALDRSPEVKADGRSAVVRRVLDDWLAARKEARIDAASRRGYGKEPGVGKDWQGWEEQGAWPDES
jgi:metal-responsive CopG/Arc/MetJ family transcriptional regulator